MWDLLPESYQGPPIFPLLLTLAQLAGAGAVTLHAILRKRETRTTIAWIGLAWLSPLLGTAAYLCLGINRIQRKGADLELPDTWRRDPQAGVAVEDDHRFQQLLEEHPSIVGLSRVGASVTGRELQTGNHVEPLVDGDGAYPAMLEAIREAEHSVSLLSYIFDSDRAGDMFFEALKGAHERGIKVRVLVDYVGSRYGSPNIIKRLKKAGVPAEAFLKPGKGRLVRYFNLRNHRKILVVDEKVGFTGGTNIREGHMLAWSPAAPVACLHFKLTGPIVAEMKEAFAMDWKFTTGEDLSATSLRHELPEAGDTLARGILDGPDRDLDKMKEVLLGAIAVASERIRIATPYFLPEIEILSALKIAAARGVEVDIVIPMKNNIWIMDWAVTPVITELLEKGCRVHLSPKPFDHTKLMVVDGVWSLIGSTNWDARSLRLNFEYNVECYSESLSATLEQILVGKISTSRKVLLSEMEALPRWKRVRDGLAQLLSPYL